VFSAQCYVSDAQSVARFAAALTDRLGVADILVHNAGIYPVLPFEATDWATWRRVTVNAIAPGIVRTPGTLSGPQQGMGLFEATLIAQAIKRIGVPEDLMGVVSFLTSDAAGFMTGQTLAVDGGVTRL
jgi:NAD(P)-dependent dehydrogenase (short-subunit alcohol dehydrogenase family)